MSNWNKLEESLILLQNISDNTTGGGGGDVNLTQIKGVAASTNAGFLDNATLRIATSWDDLNINAINTHLTNIENAVVPPAVLNTNQSEIAGTTTAINSGTLDNGTQRVCIATDDVPMAAINAHLATIESDIAQIKAILTDVWDDASNALRVV